MSDSRQKDRACGSVKTRQESEVVPVPPRYVVIMPARNEEKYIGAALESLVTQLCPASLILVVDDGSTDSTPDIVRQYSQKYPFVRLLSRADRGYEHPGPGVVDAFYDGLDSLGDLDFDFVAKLDADCEFPRDYFATILAEYERNPKLGICGGMAYIRTEIGLQMDWRPGHHIRGATKIYRKACFLDIGGIERVLGWDVLDEFTARFKCWEVYTVESLHFVMNRSAGGQIGLWRMWIGSGKIAYMQHHSLLYLLTRAIRRSVDRPYVLGGVLILVGYVVGWWESLPRIEDPYLIRFIQGEQRRYLWKLLTLQATGETEKLSRK